ncbi:MAG: type ISP restriction/modification enzyme [Myxococcota bacterium]|nr:type ISP restriction/modification enzyme [Myxococcota bacterium]
MTQGTAELCEDDQAAIPNAHKESLDGFGASPIKLSPPIKLFVEKLARCAHRFRRALAAALDVPSVIEARAMLTSMGGIQVTASDAEYVDTHTQCLTYGLLTRDWLARTEYAHGDPLTEKVLASLMAVRTIPTLDVALNALIVHVQTRPNPSTWRKNHVDPTMHFYPCFLDAYAPEQRASRGVYYTPDVVVEHMVARIHAQMIDTLGLPLGLADTTTWADYAQSRKIELPADVDGAAPVVNLMDPATGTGTFLVHVIRLIHRVMMGQWGDESDEIKRRRWRDYWAGTGPWAGHGLTHRLAGIEIMPVPYFVCRLRLASLLGTLTHGAVDLRPFDLRLANALDHSPTIPPSSPITVILGNPPFSIHSGSLTANARALVEPFKSVGGTRIREKGALQLERNLNDDYVKFWGLALQWMRCAPCAVSCFITNRAFMDNPTLRGVRDQMLTQATHVSILDLRGDVKRRVEQPDGQSDENIFPIQQGVAITSLIRDGRETTRAKVTLASIEGARTDKLTALADPASQCAGQPLDISGPLFAFVKHDPDVVAEYAHFIELTDLMPHYSNGIVTARDRLVIHRHRDALLHRMHSFTQAHDRHEHLATTLGVRPKLGWDMRDAQSRVGAALHAGEDWIFPVLYRPFDRLSIFYHPSVIQTASSMSWQMCLPGNYSLLVPRRVHGEDYRHVMVTQYMSEAICLSTRTSVNGNCFPLWYEPDAKNHVLAARNGRPGLGSTKTRHANLDLSRVPKSLKFMRRLPAETVFFAISAILHSANYRHRYGALLSLGFPRVPIPKCEGLLTQLALIGRRLPHLYDLEAIQATVLLSLDGVGDGMIRQAHYDPDIGRVFINHTQSIGPISLSQWQFYIGDYPIIKRWLVGGRAVTRKGTALTVNDLNHLSRVLTAIDRLMNIPHQVDQCVAQYGGWPSAFTQLATP